MAADTRTDQRTVDFHDGSWWVRRGDVCTGWAEDAGSSISFQVEHPRGREDYFAVINKKDLEALLLAMGWKVQPPEEGER